MIQLALETPTGSCLLVNWLMLDMNVIFVKSTVSHKLEVSISSWDEYLNAILLESTEIFRFRQSIRKKKDYQEDIPSINLPKSGRPKVLSQVNESKFKSKKIQTCKLSWKFHALRTIVNRTLAKTKIQRLTIGKNSQVLQCRVEVHLSLWKIVVNI